MFRPILISLFVMGFLSIAGCSGFSNTTTTDCPTFDGFKTNPERDFRRYQKHAKSLRKSSHGYGPYGSFIARGKRKPKKIKMKNTIRVYPKKFIRTS